MENTTNIDFSSSTVSNLSTSVGGRIISVPKSVSDFITEELIIKLGEMINATDENGKEKGWHWHAFAIMGIGIEFLGKAIDPSHPNDWDFERESRISFEYAIEHISGFSPYRNLVRNRNATGYDLYAEFRCGLAHMFKPKPRTSLSHGDKEMENKLDDNNLVNFNCHHLFSDFKNSCEEVVKRIQDNTFAPGNKVYEPFIYINGTITEIPLQEVKTHNTSSAL